LGFNNFCLFFEEVEGGAGGDPGESWKGEKKEGIEERERVRKGEPEKGERERRRKEEGGRRKEEGGRRKEERGRRKEEEGRRKEEGGRRKEEGGTYQRDPRRGSQKRIGRQKPSKVFLARIKQKSP
jgi:ATP-dependent RNA helicase DHX57